jgi:tRNA pseudouridine55 synthase
MPHTPSGFLVLDKPPGITSRDAVDHVLDWFPRQKVGHAGTLDPAATGVLIVGVGSIVTRFIEYVQDQEKEYTSTFTLGGNSTTDDAEGEITVTPDVTLITEATLRTALQRFVGTLQQTPPAFSAAKIQGERAHTKARRGEPVELKPRAVTVHELELVSYTWPTLEVRIRCSKGTYIRSIARDLGQSLGCGGYVQTLRRTRIGGITTDQAIPWQATAEEAQAALYPLSLAVAHLTRVEVSSEEARRLQQGQGVPTSARQPDEVSLWQSDQFIGIAKVDGPRLKPVKMVSLEM